MTLILTEEQTMLREAARDYLGTRLPVSHLRHLRDSQDPLGFSREAWAEMADMGWAAIAIPESYGGLDYGYTGLGLILEECGRTLTPSPLLSTALLGSSCLVLSGNGVLCERWLPAAASGAKLLSLAFEESARHRPEEVNTRAEQQGDGFRISGDKLLVMDGHCADAFVVSARTRSGDDPHDTISLFLVPAGAEGLAVETTQLLDCRFASQVRLDGVRVGRDQLLGNLHGGYPVLSKTLDRGRAGMAAEMLGIAQEVFARTVEYLKDRKQFGVPIGSFQALQHRAAILFGEIELCRSVVLKALQAIDADSDDVPLLSSLAKAKCGQTAELATAEAIQMHGGIGMTDEFDIGFFIKRWRSLNQQLGDARYHFDRFARLRAY